MALKPLKVNSNKQHDKDTSKTEQQLETSKVTQETKKKIKSENKKYSCRRTELHLRRKVTVPLVKTNQSDHFCNHSNTPQIAPLALPIYYPQYPQNYGVPISISEWNPLIAVQNSLNIQPIPVIINPPQIIATQIVPYIGPTIPVLPVITPITANDITVTDYELYATNEIESPEYTTNQTSHYTEVYTSECNKDRIKNEIKECDLVDFYITLPKDLFPAARMLTLDPNPIIDEFCKIPNVQQHAPWLLDLEFGVPKSPITRPIPIYSVKFNSVHCKNTPEAIHPGFESCSQDFKRVFLFYYDCIISAWYRGYIIMNYDKSVDNFQSWLLLPMQVFGMCWP